MRDKRENNKGITIVALVTTIILMLILAGISIQSMTNTGIFGSTRRAELENKRGQVIEYLNLKLLNQQMLNPTGAAEDIVTATRTSIVKKELEQIGKKVEIGEISKEENFKQVQVYFYVTVDDDIYKVEATGISFVGNKEELAPIIKIVKMSNTTNSITVEVETLYNEGGKLEYYIKGEQDTDYDFKKTTTDKSYTFEGLEQEKQYSVKVKAIAKNKKTAEVIGQQTTGTVTEITTADTTFSYEPVQETWTNESVTVTVSTTVTGYTLQTRMNGTAWESKDSQTFTENGTIYARLYDGKNGGKALAGNVTNIDKLAPKDFTPTATSTTNSLTVTANTEDADATKENGGSGIAGYRFKLDNENWTAYQTSGTYTWNSLKQTTDHTITVEAKDKAGNTTTGTVSKGTATVTTLTTANTTFTYTPAQGTWTNGSVTATVSTTVTGYTLQTSKDAKTWSNATSQTFAENGYIYARLWDGTNESPALAGNVTNIDKNNPTINSLTQGETSTHSITVTVNATDNESGVSKYRYSSDGGTTWSGYTKSTSYKLENLYKDFGATYSIAVEATDTAGNTAIKKENMSTSTNNDYIVSEAGTELMRYNWDSSGTGGYRKITKANSGKAIMGVAHIGNLIAPVIVGTNTDAVIYKTSDSGDNLFTSTGSIEYGGTTYYYSSDGYWFAEGIPYSSNYRSINQSGQSFSTLKDAAQELLTKYYTNNVAGYEISYNENGGSFTREYTFFNPNTSVKLTSAQPTRSGYKFSNWNDKYDGTGTTYLAGGTYTISGSATLYAQYIPEVNDKNVTVSCNPSGWTNGNVTATVSTTVTGYTLQTSTNGKDWSNATSQIFTTNGTIYARLWNGITATSTFAKNITTIDKTGPLTPTITYNSGSNADAWQNNINITLSSSDSQSGVAYYQIDWDGDGASNTNTSANFIPWNRLEQLQY